MDQAPPSTQPVSTQIQLVVGPFYLGCLFNWMLLGIFLLQLYLYSLRKKSDPIWLKLLIGTVVTIDLVETGLSSHAGYQVLVAFWGVPNVLNEFPRTYLAQSLTSALIATCVQSFYAWRIWILGTSNYRRLIVPLVILLSLLQSGAAMFSVINEILHDDRSQLAKNTRGYAIWLCAGMSADILITISMLLILRSNKAASSFTATQNLLSRLIRQTVTSGLATASLVAVGLATFIQSKNNSYFIFIGYGIGKLYSNSFLANLNARPDLKRDLNETSTANNTSHELRTFGGSNFRRKGPNSGNEIHIDTISETVGENSTIISSPNKVNHSYMQTDSYQLASKPQYLG